MDRKKEEDFIGIKRMVRAIPCLAHFDSDRDNIVTTDARRTAHGTTRWQKQTDSTIRPVVFPRRYLKAPEKNFLIGELELVAVVWGLNKFRFYLYDKLVYLYNDH